MGSLYGLLFILLIAAPLIASDAPVYIPLDSWIYPAMKRLAALGYMPDEELLAEPWTRAECKVLADEAQDIASRFTTKTSTGELNGEAQDLIAALKGEFSDNSVPHAQARIESIYARYMQIAGPPLRDSYHFGQTLVDDFGRPYETGANAIAGFSASATWGRFSGYFRGEYQEAGSQSSYPQNIQFLIGSIDGVPPKSGAISSSNKFDPLEMYIGVNLKKFNITVGKQSLWWGPGQDSAFSFSDNAEPLYALRIAQQAPFVLPGVLRYLVHIRTQFLLGELSGHSYPPHPLMNAETISFQVTENLEVGFTRSAIFAGTGHPLTAASFLRSFFSIGSTGGTAFGSAGDPGDRRSGFDFSWHLPGLRRSVTIYSDSLADDEPNPLDSPRRSAWAPGILFSHLPKVKKLDLRLETYSTWLYRGDVGGQFFYWNNQYRDAYTNDNRLLGSWIGRDARAYVASSTYWFSAQRTITLSFRQNKIGSDFIPGGGTQTDISVKSNWQTKFGFMATPQVQYERYFIPALGSPRKNLSVGIELIFSPGKLIGNQ
jgi:hypothetical protein